MTEISTLRLCAAAALFGAVLLERPLRLSPYTAWGLSLPILCWCALPFHRGLAKALRAKHANTDMLLSVGLSAAFLFSTVAVFASELLVEGLREHRLGTLAALVLVSLFGRWLEMRLTERSGEALGKILRRLPRTARLIRGGAEFTALSADIRPGDRIVVPPGELVPVDGEVVSGESRVDESIWTGTQSPAGKSAGSKVTSGTLNKDGTLTVEARKVGKDSALGRLVDAVVAGFELKSGRARMADGIARGYLPAVVITAVGAALLWSWKGPEPRHAYAFTALALVLVAACPWAVDLAAPAAIGFGIRRAGRGGLRMRNPALLTGLERPDVVVFDKKGFLTEGRPEVGEVICFGNWQPAELLRQACAAERSSGHPFSEALKAKAPAGPLPEPQSIETYPGRGVSVLLEGRRVLAGSPAWLLENGISPSERHARTISESSESLMGVAVDGKLAGLILFRDPLRPGTREGVRALQEMGLEVVLVSGDRNAAAHRIAELAGISRVYAEVLQEDKVSIVAQLQERGKRVVMVGEGFRDAPALSRADLGVAVSVDAARPPAQGPGESGPTRGPALGAGIDLGAESADLILPRRDLGELADALRLSLLIRRTIRENLRWAFGLHIVALPVAGGALLLSLGIGLTPPALTAVAGAGILAVGLNSRRRFR